MPIHRRQLLSSFAAGVSAVSARKLFGDVDAFSTTVRGDAPLHRPNGDVDWNAVRAMFPLSRDWTHLAVFLFVSHPKPVADSIAYFRNKIDSDHVWLEDAVLTDSEGRPYAKVKQALAWYTGSKPSEICLTSNTTSGLALAYHGLRIRPDQEVLTSTHDHYVHHESIRYAAARTGFSVRQVPMYDVPSRATASEMTERIAKAITPKTRAVGVTWVHSSTGVVTPIKEIAAAVARANSGRASADRCLLIVDGVHGFGNRDVDLASLGADFVSVSLHKWMLGPRGTGFLWGRTESWPELRPTIPAFDPDGAVTWDSWMNKTPLPPTQASFVSPGGFLAYEHFLAIPAAIDIHRTLGRRVIASRIADLNGAFREGAAKIPKLKLHTPSDPSVSGGLTCYEIAGKSAKDTTTALEKRRIRTNASPYKVPVARVAAGVMNSHEDIDAALRALRDIAR